MAEFLGLGLTHHPLLAGTGEHMAGLLRGTRTDPDIPTELKDPPTLDRSTFVEADAFTSDKVFAAFGEQS